MKVLVMQSVSGFESENSTKQSKCITLHVNPLSSMYTLSGTGDVGGGVDVMTEQGDGHKTRQPSEYNRKECLRSTEAKHEEAYFRPVYCTIS
jgi:hypothetical protein